VGNRRTPWSSEAASGYSPFNEGHKEKRDRVSCGLLRNRDWATTRSSWPAQEACVSSGTRWSVFRSGCKMSSWASQVQRPLRCSLSWSPFCSCRIYATSIGKEELCWCGLELCDAGLVLLQLVLVPAELLRTDGVLLLERLDSFQDAV